jgi:hypothetical protein
LWQQQQDALLAQEARYAWLAGRTSTLPQDIINPTTGPGLPAVVVAAAAAAASVGTPRKTSHRVRCALESEFVFLSLFACLFVCLFFWRLAFGVWGLGFFFHFSL